MIFNRNNLLVLTLFFSIAFNLAFAGVYFYHRVSGEPPPPRWDAAGRLRERETPRHGMRMEQLSLTEEQREELKARRQRLREDLRTERETARELREQFILLLEDPDAEPDEIAEAARNFYRTQERMRTRILDDLIQTRQMLDPEQRRTFGRTIKHRHRPPITDDRLERIRDENEPAD